MTFLIEGLDPGPFQHLYGLSDSALGDAGARRVPVTANFGFPDRIEMRDLDVGESALLLNYTHMAATRHTDRATLSSFWKAPVVPTAASVRCPR